MEAVNDFSRGMQSDVSKLIQAKNTYLEAINFRPFTELGASNTSLVTIKGNECGVKFPTMNDIFKLKIDIKDNTTFTDTIDFTIIGPWGTDTVTGFTVNSSTNIFTLYQEIIALPNYGTEYTAAYKDDYIMIYQRTTTVDCVDDVSPFTVDISENSAPGTQNTIWYVKPDGTFVNNPIGLGDDTFFIPAAVDPLIPIGYTTILEDVYLFVAEDNPAYTDIYPSGIGIPTNDSYSYPGYIFKLQYDESTSATTLTLVYAAYLNFTKYAAIAPSAAIGRYESQEIQRIYWSDFYNKVKTLNVTDPQVMAINPILTGLNPSVGFDIPIMTNIIAGSLNVGTYELCYRLKQTLGAITNYSTVSNMVHLASPSITDFLNYEGSVPGSNSNKGIRFKISNVDNAYDVIEYIVLFRDSDTDVCKVYSLDEENIPTSGIVTVDVTSLASADEILLTDFLAIQSSFTHAKTVDTKDNRLFWGNVKTKRGSLPSWDARAFRAKTTDPIGLVNNDDVYLINNGVSTGAITQAAAEAFPETYDCINEYYDNTGGFGTDACYYKPGAAYVGGSPVLGGAGANISYEFGTLSISLDDNDTMYNYDAGYNIYSDVPFRNVNGDTRTQTLLSSPNDSPNQTYTLDTFNSMKSPYRSSLLKGFQHEEIYRFAFEALDLEGNPYFSKWIGDIKMPSYGDPNTNPDPTALAYGVTDFRLSYNGSSPNSNVYATYGQVLYIKFEVDVTAIKDVISGYRIVRMERDTNANKTILGCGLITPTYAENAVSNDVFLPSCWRYVNRTIPTILNPANQGKPWNPSPSQDVWETLTIDAATHGSMDPKARTTKTFDCFDFFVNNGFSAATGDKMLIRSKQTSKNYVDALAGNSMGYRWWDYSNGNGADWYNIGGPPRTMNALKPLVESVFPLFGPGAYGIDAYNFNTGLGATVNHQTGYDSDQMPYYIHKYMDNNIFGTFATVSASGTYNVTIDEAQWVEAGINETAAFGTGAVYCNYGRTYGTGGQKTINPCIGHSTLAMSIALNETAAPFSCDPSTDAGKLLALYYRPNTNQYGGNTYASRAGNTYIACGSYIPIKRNGLVLTNNLSLTIDTLGGDIQLGYWDMQKASKDVSNGSASGPIFEYYGHGAAIDTQYAGGLGVTPLQAEATVSVTLMFPCTNIANSEMRFGAHINRNLTSNVYIQPDTNTYANYHSNESNVVKYFSEPLDFVESDKWINRVHYSEVKYNNETKDSWQVYKTNNFYDVEGNYGSINALVAFKENLYYIQERGFGILYVNPMTAVTSDNNIPVVLGLGATIQRHNYIKLDVGTMHQWSVFRSPDNISFIDSRHKTQYMFNGQSLQPVSDLKGQRNFFIKRFHPDIILRDNPIIGKGVHTTYDFYHKEFLTTFNNEHDPADVSYEQYTIAYSEAIDAYSSLYTCVPKTYFNNNRYIFSFDNTESIYVHNVGYYGTFYEVENPSYLKVLVNDNPKYTKVFDNLILTTESIDDQIEWIDEVITPSSNTQVYSDNINMLTDTFNELRCYTDAYNTDWTALVLDFNLKKKEQSWFTPVPRNKVEYDTLTPSTSSIFDPAVLTKLDFGERLRDKYMVVDLKYNNADNRRFIVHNLRTMYRPSAR